MYIYLRRGLAEASVENKLHGFHAFFMIKKKDTIDKQQLILSIGILSDNRLR